MGTTLTINSFFADTVKRYPDKPALVFFDQVITYSELEDQVCRAVDFLQRHWVHPGGRVAMLLPNCPQFVIFYLAALRQGCVVAAINPLASPEEVAAMIRQTDPKLIVTLVDFAKHNAVMRQAAADDCKMLVANLGDYLPLRLRWGYQFKNWLNKPPEGSLSWQDVMNCYATYYPCDPVEPNQLAVLQFTGGTTGVPKAAMLTHSNIASNVLQALSVVDGHVSQQSVFLGVLPFFHVYAMSVCLNVALTRGSTLVMMSRFNARQVLKLIERYRVTILPVVSRMLAALVKEPRARMTDFSSVKLCVNGAGALHADLRREVESVTGMNVIEGYGLSEASPIVSINPPENNQPGSLGKLVSETEARIIDGELLVRGPQVMAGYWRNKEETEKILTPDGWLRTGDMVRVDADGFYWMEDRKKDMGKRRGENVFSTEIEEVIASCPGVSEVAVVFLPSKTDEKMIACVVKAANGLIPEHGVLDWCRAHLPSYKIPDTVVFFDEFPKNYLGKVLKKDLRKKLQTPLE